MGEKIWWLVKKKRRYQGEQVEKWGKELKIFTVPKGQNIILEKGGGAKISYFGQIYNHEIIDGAIHQHFIYKKTKQINAYFRLAK